MTTPVQKGTVESFDDTPISFSIRGRGGEVILCLNGIGVASWVWLPLEEYISRHFKIITFDWRGHGLSGSPQRKGKASFDHLVEDALHIIDKLRIKKAHLIGHSTGFQVALEVLRKRPEAVKSLVSCLGTPGKALSTFMDSFIGQLVFDLGYILNAVLPSVSHWINTNLLAGPATYQIGAALKLVNPAIHGKEAVGRYLKHFTKINFDLFNHLIASSARKSAEDLLPQIKTPTLIIAAEHDRFVPIDVAKRMHKKIRGSELFIIRNGTHAALFEQPDIFNLCIERFLKDFI